MCTYNTISSHIDHFEIQKRDLEESLLTYVNLFPSKHENSYVTFVDLKSYVKIC